jgi:molecular chaperone DnaK (HSP70)
MVCLKGQNCLVGFPARNDFRDYPELTMFISKRLIEHKFLNKHVENDIKNWPVKVIKDKKSCKP